MLQMIVCILMLIDLLFISLVYIHHADDIRRYEEEPSNVTSLDAYKKNGDRHRNVS